MSQPIFLSVSQVEELHANSIAQFGGTLGLRDRSTLEAAVLHPQNVYHYVQGDLFEIAAAYCFHIAEAQAFLDGNKRAAASAALTFLRLNGISIKDEPAMLHNALIAVAERRYGKAEIAALFRRLMET